MSANIIHEEPVGIGACGTGDCGVDYPSNYDIQFLGCYYNVLPQAVLSVAANTAFSLVFNPVDPFFTPFAVSAVVRDSTAKDIRRPANFGSVTIDGCRYEGVNTSPLTATSTQFWTSEKWDPTARDGCACPVRWGLFTNQANGYPLTIGGFNPNAVPIDVIVEIYGKSERCSPSWCTNMSDPSTWRLGLVQSLPPAMGGVGTAAVGGRAPAFGGR
jgi:hypothetical protein